ncbi:hypothetical protein C8Q76DRAFT_703476 [Earliella scabrosa]|nr:hypothetical protein C8Q76DRAFT_703476 [Earliella scabrosa]
MSARRRRRRIRLQPRRRDRRRVRCDVPCSSRSRRLSLRHRRAVFKMHAACRRRAYPGCDFQSSTLTVLSRPLSTVSAHALSSVEAGQERVATVLSCHM